MFARWITRTSLCTLLLASGTTCNAKENPNGPTLGDKPIPPKPPAPEPVIPAPPPPEQVSRDLCRNAYYTMFDTETDGDPFAVVRQDSDSWNLSADVDGVIYHLEPSAFTDYSVSVGRVKGVGSEVLCRVPSGWKVQVLAVDMEHPSITEDYSGSEQGAKVRALGGIVLREMPFADDPMLSVHVTWVLRPSTVESNLESFLRAALQIGQPLSLELTAYPAQVADGNMPGLAVAFSSESNPSTARLWGVLSDPVRGNKPRNRTTEVRHFFPFDQDLPATDSVSALLNDTPFVNLQNLALWDSQRGERVRCSQTASQWNERCGYILPASVKQLVQETAGTGVTTYGFVLWERQPDEYYLTTVAINQDGETHVEGTSLLSDSGIADKLNPAALKSLRWP